MGEKIDNGRIKERRKNGISKTEKESGMFRRRRILPLVHPRKRDKKRADMDRIKRLPAIVDSNGNDEPPTVAADETGKPAGIQNECRINEKQAKHNISRRPIGGRTHHQQAAPVKSALPPREAAGRQHPTVSVLKAWRVQCHDFGAPDGRREQPLGLVVVNSNAAIDEESLRKIVNGEPYETPATIDDLAFLSEVGAALEGWRYPVQR